VSREDDSLFVQGLVILAKDLLNKPMETAILSVVTLAKLRDLYIGFKMEGFGGDEDMSRLNMGSGFVKLSIAKWSKADQEEALKGEKEKMREMLEKKLEKVELPNIWNDKESSSRGRARSSRSRENDAAEMDCARMGERSAVERAV
jgi:hypothetical protein